MGNSILAKLSQYPLTQKLSVLILFTALLVQFTAMVYFRFSPLVNEVETMKNFETKIGKVTDKAAVYVQETTETMPKQARIPHGHPRYYQMERGTCWDFALIGFLQDNYRQNGIEKGFLDPTEYVKLSTQVLGIRMVEHCNEHPDVCNTPGDMLLQNSTSGGEINWFYSFTELYKEMLPDSVCPYTPTDVDEFVCENMEKATETNPIQFNITKMNIAMTVEDVKKLFIEKNKRALAWTSLIHSDYEYFVCDEYAEICNSGLYDIIDCPIQFGVGKKCVKITFPMHTPDAEFDRHSEMQMAGGHGMVMVGYNDEFVTRAGHKGGFILKNSWNDTIYGDYPGATSRNARGSHSIEYFMGEISGEDERYVCPNAQDPLNWASCVLCWKNNSYNEFALEKYKTPYEFRCVNEKICSRDPVYRYFMKSLTPSTRQPNGRYYDLVMYKINSLDNSKVELEFKALPLQVIALYFTPIDEQVKRLTPNQDYCGYYFFPYDIVEQQIAYFGGFNCIYYDIDWNDSSYLANKDKEGNEKYDYSYIEASTGVQNFDEVKFYGSAPYINERYD